MTQHAATWHQFGKHGMRAAADHDEGARLDFHMSLFRHLWGEAGTAHRAVYDASVKPQFVRQHNREPENRHEVRKAMLADPYFRFWSHLRVHVQESYNYDNARTVEKQIDELAARARPTGKEKGALELDPDFEIPKYQASFDMHWMPGSFFTEVAKGDVTAGALYDMGGIYLITNGKLGPYNDGAAYSVISYLRTRFPDFEPESILDQGCTVGHNTLPFKEAWPEASVTGIDIGAPVLRYAHKRADDLGFDVNFSQQNAERTKFDHESFDFIVSTMFLHETSHKAVYNIVAENHRLLKPGGLMLHVEQPPFARFDDPFDQFVRDWDTHNNNEPFWGPMHDMDLEDVALRAGFAAEDVIQEMTPLVQPTKTDKYAPGAGEWFVFAAWKR